MTAARSGEVRGAAWSEIDLDKALWVIPADRMKMSREHRVPLTPVAVALLKALPRLEGNDLVFPAIRGGQLSDMTLSATMRRIHQAEIDAQRPGFVDRASNALPFRMAFAARSAIGWQSALTTPVKWQRLLWRIGLVAQWKPHIGGDMISVRHDGGLG